MLLSRHTPATLRNLGHILSHACKSKDYLAAVSLCCDMDALCIRFDVYIANIWISSYVNLGCVSCAFSVFGKMLKKGCPADVFTYTTLLRGLCMKRDSIDEAARFFHRLVLISDCPMNVITFNTLVKGLVRTGRVKRAVSLLFEMDKLGTRDYRPDLITYKTVFHGLCKKGFRKEALQLFQDMKRKRVMPDCVTYNTLIWGLSFGRNSREDARTLFNEMKRNGVEPTVVTYTTLMSTLCKYDNLAGANQLLQNMMKSGLGANIVTYNVLIKGLCIMGKAQKALQLLQKMSGWLWR